MRERNDDISSRQIVTETRKGARSVVHEIADLQRKDLRTKTSGGRLGKRKG
jgi:hypothetical protein